MYTVFVIIFCNLLSDIDECSTLNPCDQHCENTWGSYICGCVTRGYILDQDGHTCKGISL